MPLTSSTFFLRSYVEHPGYLDLGMRNVEFSSFITTVPDTHGVTQTARSYPKHAC